MLYGRTSTQIITYEFEQKGRNHMVLTDISKFLCTAEQLQNSEYQLTKRMTCKQKKSVHQIIVEHLPFVTE